MANGYIGKISAVVTANTSDLSRKLSEAVGDVDKFANKLNASVSRASASATASLDKIFTPLQRLERQFSTALKLNLRTEEDIQKIRQLVSVSEQINKPLEKAAGSFSKLSLEVQGAFLPAIDRAQTAVVNLSNTLQQQGSVSEKSFKQVAQIVDQTTASVQKLTQAQQLASQSFSGNELQFGNPRLFETLNRGATLTRQASSLPADSLVSGDIARQVQALRQYQNAAVAADAKVSSLRLTPDVDPAAIVAAERQLQSLIETATRAQQRLGNAIEVSENIGASTQLRSTADPTGRSIQERVQSLARARQQEEAVAEATRKTAKAQGEAVAAVQRRAQAEREFYAESTRLQQQAAADAAAPLIARAQAEREYYAESRRLQQQAAADAAAPLIARAQAEREFNAESTRLQQQSAADAAAPLIARAAAEREYYAESKRLQQQAASDAASPLIARAQAEREYYAESTRLQQQAAADAAAPLIARAQAEREYYAESRRLQQQAAADAAVPLIARAQAEREFYAESTRLQQQAAADAAAPLIARAQAEREFNAESTRLQQQAAADEAAPLAARAQAEREFYAESERLQKQAAADAAATLIARAQAEREFYAERERLMAASAEDRMAEANRRLAISPDQPPPLVEGFSTRLPRGYLGDRAASDARASLGSDVNDVFRQFDQLGGTITALKSQVAGLSLPLRTEFAPEIRRLEDTWVRLNARGPAATAEEIENARQETERLSQSLRRANQADALPTFDTFASNASSRRAAAELEALGNILQRVEAEAGGPAAAAFDRLRQRTQEAIRTGTAGLPAVRRELELLQREAAEAAAQTGRISAGGAFREIQRTGDVARGAFGGAGLAIQQAAFAVDDFFSVTGGLDQRIRAAGNNISQLGFILGGTAGLFAGIATSITAQALVALVRFANGGRTAEDQTKALNEALARQKSLVEELAQAFRSVGDSIERAFSPAAQSGRQFGKELDNIKKKQEEARRANLGLFDPDVQLQRAEQNRITRQIGQAEDPATILRLQRELATAQRREQALLDGLVAGAPRTPEQRNRAIASLEDAFTNAADTRRNPRPFAREQARANIRVLQGMDAPQQIEALRGQQRYIQIAADRGEISRARADEANLAIEAVIARLEDGTRAAIDELTINIARAAQNAATSIENAQEDVAEAIRRGVPGAAVFQAALDNSARQLTDAFAQLDAASNIADQDQRRVEVERAQGRVDDVLMRRDAIAERSRELRLGRTFGGDRTTAALSSLQSNDRFANEMAGMTAAVARAADDEFAARQKLSEATRDREQAERDGNAAALKNAQAREEAARNELEAAQKAGEVAALMGEAALAMEEALDRLRKVVADAVSQSEGIANDAQQRLNEDPTLENRQDRDRAERQLISDRERAARAQNAIDARRAESMSDPRVAAINAELASIDQERQRLAEEARVNGNQTDPRQMQQLADREARLLAEREQVLFDLTAAERESADTIGQETAARRMVIEEQIREAQVLKELADRLANIQNPRGDALRGQELSLSPAQRAAQEMAQGAADINAYFDAAADLINPDGIIAGNELERLRQNEVDRNAALERFQQDQARQIAPLLVGFAQEVENALAQGPSRAALGASDSSTLEGQRELNRLLRGDDQNRNVDLAELQRQANNLLEAIARNTEDGAPVAA